MNGKKIKLFRKALPLYIMVLPGFVYLLINNYIPMFGIVIAFKNLNFSKGILKSDWAGFSNFEYLFKAPDALLVTRNTLLYNTAFIIVNTFAAILIAILLSELRSKTKVKLFQSCVLIPSLISIIIYSDFGLFYQVPMNSGALFNATNTIDTYVYRGLIELGDISMSSAACVYQSLVGFVLVLAANRITRKYSAENALF